MSTKDVFTQEKMVLTALKDGWRLTPLVAWQRFGCFRLGARIYDLRRKGYTIQVDRALGPKPYAIYWMKPKDRKRK